LILILFSGKVGHKGMSNTIMQLRKVCNHPYVFNMENGIDWSINDDIWRSAGKFDV
jgi:ATP-dependent helicase STH1/SNF2